MKKSIAIFLLLATASAAGAPALDLESRSSLRRSALVSHASPRTRSLVGPATGSLWGFASVSDDFNPADLADRGAHMLSRAGRVILLEIDRDSIDAAASAPGILRLQLSRTLQPKLDRARAASRIDAVHSGIDLPRAFTGKGVITGIVDGGMDPNHINFRDADGNTRIKHFTYIRANNSGTGMLVSKYTPEQLPDFSTDDATTYHGTHTMGIMAGSYRGPVDTGAGTLSSCPYYGVAPESDIAASCGQLNDMFIAYGVEYIAQYAYEQRKRLVVNLSLGSNLGPHDGSGLMGQYLDAVSAQDNIIFCISSGNEGDTKIALNATFTPEQPTVQTFIHPMVFGAEDRYTRYGTVHIYSADSTAFDTQVVIYNRTRGRVAFRMPITGNTGGEGKYWISSSDYATSSSDAVSPELAKAFDGYVGLGSMIDPDNGRFYALVDVMTFNNLETNADNQYLIGIQVTGKDGKRVDFYSDGLYDDFSSEGIEGWTDGTSDGTVSDLAATRSAIVVGSHNVRDSWTSLDGNDYGYQGLFSGEGMTPFTSWGTLPDGRSLPHVCAPGATVISSSSTPFVYDSENGIGPEYLQATVGSSYFYEQMAGTSMSSPLVAGAVALWLEADPTLTPAEVREIACLTARRDLDVTATGNPVQWGAGKFDAHAGLLEVLRRQAGAADAVADRLVLAPAGHRAFRVALPGTDGLAVTLTDATGRIALTASADTDETVIDLSHLAKGVYILTVNQYISRKIIIK